jgi:hypothetical protein
MSKVPPTVHPLRTPVSTSVTVSTPIDTLLNDLFATASTLSMLMVKKNEFVYACSSYKKQELLHFEIRIYITEDNQFLIEFKHLRGDRFSFAELLHDIGKMLKVDIPGGRTFDMFDEVDVSNHEQMKTHLDEFILVDPHQCLPSLAACARDIAKSGRGLEFFGPEGTWRDIVSTVVNLATKEEFYLACVSVLADIAEVAVPGDPCELSTILSQSIGYHERREAIRLALNCKKHGVLFPNVYFNVFDNDKPALEMFYRLVNN